MAINVTAEPFVLLLYQRGNISHTPAHGRDYTLDQTFDLSDDANDEDIFNGLALTTALSGSWLNKTVIADPFVLTTRVLPDSTVLGLVIVASPFVLTTGIGSHDESLGLLLTPPKTNWLKWSNIGSLDFTIWKDNVAGERPVDWRGWIYAAKKLSGKVAVYGENGVTFLTPVGAAWGMSTASKIGLKGQRAICGNDELHFYVDVKGRMFSVSTSGIELLGYEEYLSTLSTSITMSFDEYNQLVYICDGLIGYVYSIRDKSLGRGPTNITGVGYQSGISYITAPASVSVPTFNICSDIYDLGSRKNKTIMSIELGAELSNALYAAVDYRLDKAVAFATTPWAMVNPNGIAVVPCFGVEFRFRLKLLSYEKFNLDYIRVNGVIHSYSYLDSFSRS